MKSLSIRQWSVARTVYERISKIPGHLADAQHLKLAALVESMLDKISHDPYHKRRKNIYLRLERIKSNHHLWNGDRGHQYPVYVINRSQDTDRFNIITHRCRKLGISLTRIEAINSMASDFDFRPYREFIPDTFWGGPFFWRGAIGCYLSHARVWKRVCESEITEAIVLEDDAYPAIPFPRTIKGFNLPTDFDLAFLTSATGEWYTANDFYTNPLLDQVEVKTYEDAIQQLLSVKDWSDSPNWLDTPTTYAYIINESGAKKLLQILSEFKISCGVDNAISIHSMSNSFLNKISARLSPQMQRGISHLPICDINRTYASVIRIAGDLNCWRKYSDNKPCLT